MMVFHSILLVPETKALCLISHPLCPRLGRQQLTRVGSAEGLHLLGRALAVEVHVAAAQRAADDAHPLRAARERQLAHDAHLQLWRRGS